ncbi:MAG: DUF3601 domain-containing protein [Anaerolineales bacterium]|jgi:hypothetical protein|nr:DUF3601 domain-containing protein [Anaerolineales bacterium]
MADTLYDLHPGAYRILQAFTDYYGNTFEAGEVLHFQERHFLPYEGGHTLVFQERAMYLQEEKNQPILNHFSAYLTRCER